MNRSILGLFQFVGSILGNIRDVFVVPPCAVCEEHRLHRSDLVVNYEKQIRHLENTISHERKQVEHLQAKLDKILRLDTRPESNVKVPVPPIHGLVSPMQQRRTAESASREAYWKSKAAKTPELETISQTEG